MKLKFAQRFDFWPKFIPDTKINSVQYFYFRKYKKNAGVLVFSLSLPFGRLSRKLLAVFWNMLISERQSHSHLFYIVTTKY